MKILARYVGIALLLTLVFTTLGMPRTQAAEAGLWINGSPTVTTVAHAYLADPVTVISIGQSMRNPLDVHVVFYLASRSAVRPLELFKKRQQNATYAQLFTEAKVPLGSLLTPCPGLRPPAALARAYRILDKAGKDAPQATDLYNEEIIGLVALKFCVETMRHSPKDVFSQLEKGATMQAVVQAAIDADPYLPSMDTPRTVAWKGARAQLHPYYAGEPHCNLAVYSPNAQGSVAPSGDGTYIMGFLRVRGRYVKGIAQPEGFEGQDLRTVPWFQNMCNRYFPACRKQGWVGSAPPDL